MKSKLIHGKWWITEMPSSELNCGAYGTKAEAEEDRVGMERFDRHENKPGYVTCDSIRRKKRRNFQSNQEKKP